MISEREVREALDAVVDPCSAAAGAPAGLDSMGLLRRVDVTRAPAGGARVSVRIALTDPTCLMGAPFVASTRDVLGAMDGVSEFDVELDEDVWTERDLSPAYRARLERVRALKRQHAERRDRRRSSAPR